MTALLLLSCHRQKDAGSHADQLLPNGKRLLDTYDSAMYLYYKEVVGSDTLSDGGITCYGEDDSLRYFYLHKGDKLFLLNQSSRLQSPWSLGVIEREYPHYFLVRIDNGNSSPGHFQVFSKRDGSNLLGRDYRAQSIYEWKDSLFLLGFEPVNEAPPDSLLIWNIDAGQSYHYPLPVGLPVACDIQIGSVSAYEFRVSYRSVFGEQFELEKLYRR